MVARDAISDVISKEDRANLRKAQTRARPIIKKAIQANTPVLTGELRASTQITFKGTVCRIRQKFYGEYVNFGTRYIVARRYIEAAIIKLRLRGLRGIQAELGVFFTFEYFGRRVG